MKGRYMGGGVNEGAIYGGGGSMKGRYMGGGGVNEGAIYGGGGGLYSLF